MGGGYALSEGGCKRDGREDMSYHVKDTRTR